MLFGYQTITWNVEKNVDWYLYTMLGLHDKYGEEFKALYTNYVEQGKYIKKLKRGFVV